MATKLRFGGSPHGLRDERGPGSDRWWHASGRVRRAIERNIDGGVLAIMLAGIALATGNVFGDALDAVLESAAAQEVVQAWQAQPYVLVANAKYASPAKEGSASGVER